MWPMRQLFFVKTELVKPHWSSSWGKKTICLCQLQCQIFAKTFIDFAYCQVWPYIIWAVKFSREGHKMKNNFHKGNYCIILWIYTVPSCQTLGIILENKVCIFSRFVVAKMAIKKCALKWLILTSVTKNLSHICFCIQ